MSLLQVRSSDPAEAVDHLERFIPGVRIGSNDAHAFFFEISAAETGALSVLDCRFGGLPVQAATEPAPTLMINVATMDHQLLRGRDVVDISQPYVLNAGYRAVCTTAHIQSMGVSDDAVDSFARQWSGDGGARLRILGSGPKSAEHARAWQSVAHSVGDLVRNGHADDPLVGASLTDLVLASVLQHFPTTLEALRLPPTTARSMSAGMRRAIEYIDAHHAEPLGMVEIAAAARLSVRGLHAAFRRDLGISPGRHLRNTRLEAARRALLAADPVDGESVATIAAAAGFAHPSRFAAAYRERFGELPSTTLRR